MAGGALSEFGHLKSTEAKRKTTYDSGKYLASGGQTTNIPSYAVDKWCSIYCVSTARWCNGYGIGPVSKMALLNIPDAIYNWMVNFFRDHEHCTKYGMSTSTMLQISASIIPVSYTHLTLPTILRV